MREELREIAALGCFMLCVVIGVAGIAFASAAIFALVGVPS